MHGSFRPVLALTCLTAALMARPLNAQSLAAWTLSAEMRIESERGPDYEFTRIVDVVPGPTGLLFVSDIRPPQIRAFDAMGNFVRAIGRSGGGPGEFQRITSIGVLADTLWTVDVSLRRVTLFAPDGRVIATFPQTPPGGSPPSRGVFTSASIAAVLPGGLAFGRASYGSSDQAAGKVPLAPLLRMTRYGVTLDTVVWVSTANSQSVMTFGRDGQMFMAQPFSDTPIAAVGAASGRVYVVDRTVATSPRDATFGVIALNLNGDTLWQRRYPYTPRRLDAERRENALGRRIEIGGVQITRNQIMSATFLPDHAAPVTAVIVASNGSLWLRRDDRPGDVEHLVIGPDGAPLATLTLPRYVTIKAVSGDAVWTTEIDEDDVQTIVRSRIMR